MTRPKPLLLLTYLALEGPQARRDVADLFWTGSAAPLRALTVTLGRLRSGALGSVASDGRRVWAEVDTDVGRLIDALERGALEAACEWYRGPFAAGVRVGRDEIELEEWVVATREWIAATLQRRLLERAAADVVAGREEAARRSADRALRVAAAPPWPPAEIADVHATLVAVGSAHATALAADAEELGIELVASRSEAVDRVRASVGDGDLARPDVDAFTAGHLRQRVRFVTSADGARIAYATAGEGPPLVKAANWMTHLGTDWSSPVWRHWLHGLARDRTLVYYDERGSGLSDRDVPLSLEAFVADLEALVDEVGLERFDLFGMSQGAATSIAYASRHPERVRRLVLYGSCIQPEDPEEARLMVELIRAGWGRDNPAFRQVFTSLFMPGASLEQMAWFNELQRVSATPDEAAALASAIFAVDARPYLARLTVPTLVLHTRRDAVVPFEAARRMCDEVAGARLVPLDSRNHVLLEHEPAWLELLSEVRRFLAAGLPVVAQDALRGNA